MKIGIVTSGNDMLTLFKFLQKYDHEYVIYYDFLNRSYGDKTFDYSLEQVKKGIGFLIKQDCEKIILPPIYELALIKDHKTILPLFQKYLHELCFTHSLVGKIGLFGDYADIQMGQKLVSEEAKNYKLSEIQKNIKKRGPHGAAGFHFPFDYRSKETALRKAYLNTLSYSDPMANAVVKHDLRYFKDAGIDTAISLNYGYFHYQNTISKFFNHKKTRFHKLEKIEEIFTRLTNNLESRIHHLEFSVSVFYTNRCDTLIQNKKLLRLLQRGKQTEVKYQEIK